jgi:hypothetical protein
MARNVSSCRVVRPGPVPRETHPRNFRPGAAGLDCATFVCASKTPLCAASATPPVSTPLRDKAESLGSIATSVSLTSLAVTRLAVNVGICYISTEDAPNSSFAVWYWNLPVRIGDASARRTGGLSIRNMPMDTQLGYDPANYYMWRAPDGFSIHLSLDLVRELATRVAGSKETRGFLLGRSVTTPFAATMAEAFVLISPFEDFESARLQVGLAATFRRTAEDAESQQRVVGYFRSQRDGQLSLSARDMQTFDRLFSENGNIGLLIRAPRRGERDAALFYWQDGRPQPGEFGFGFPFDAKKLAGGHPGWRFSNSSQQEQKAPARSVARPAPEAPPLVAPSQGIRWSRLWPTAALVVTGIVAAQVVWNSRGTTSADSTPAVEATQTSTAASYVTPLGLKVTSEPHLLEIRWNRAASAITAAAKGTMRISEAGVTEVVPFDPRELREGSVAYTPKTNDVSIRLEVTAADGAATTESIRAVAIP